MLCFVLINTVRSFESLMWLINTFCLAGKRVHQTSIICRLQLLHQILHLCAGPVNYTMLYSEYVPDKIDTSLFVLPDSCKAIVPPAEKDDLPESSKTSDTPEKRGLPNGLGER